MPSGNVQFTAKYPGSGETVNPADSEKFILCLIASMLASGGAGGGGNVVITAPLGAQTPSASVATAITGVEPNGNTTTETTKRTSEGPVTIASGAISIEFLLSTDFVGTINGAAFDNTVAALSIGVYRVDAPPWKPLAAFIYTITAGSAIRTVQT